MSEKSTAVTAELFRYVAEHTTQEDRFLRELKIAAVAAGLPPIWIAPEQGSLMQILLRLVGAREVIEVGTLAGYSALWMARALPRDGCVHTIEISGTHADFAERQVAGSDAAGKIRIYRGAAGDILPKFRADSADAMFIDADKPNYESYLRHALRIVRGGGLIMADNAFAFGAILDPDNRDKEVTAMRSFNSTVARETSLMSIIIPAGDGLWVAFKR